jgi:ATP-dependent RNA helicase DDX3X
MLQQGRITLVYAVGKTFAFLLPVIATISGANEVASETVDTPARVAIDERGVLVRALVLAPTRELASQINQESRKLCNNSTLRSTVVYGGADIRAQLVQLASGTDVLVATPGRLLDLVDRGVVSLEVIEFLVVSSIICVTRISVMLTD